MPRRRKSTKATSHKARHRDPTRKELRAAAAWPILETVSTNPVTLGICGCGMVNLARISPTGEVMSLLALLDYSSGPLKMGAVIYPDEASYRKCIIEEGVGDYRLAHRDLDLVFRIFWEAVRFDVSQDIEFTEEGESLIELIPRPDRDEANQSVDRDENDSPFEGVMSPEFLAIAVENRELELPPGQESLCFTTATFEVERPGRVLSRLKSDEAFHAAGRDGGAHCFGWTREYPDGHESPLAGLGGRQSLGSVKIEGEQVTVETRVPSWAGRFADDLEEHFPGEVELLDVTWKPLNVLMKVSSRRSPGDRTRRRSGRGSPGEENQESPSPKRKRKKSVGNSTSTKLYTLKIWLGRASTEEFDEISRTIEVAGHHTLADLHHAIFEAFDREEEHLWEFSFTKRNSRVVARRYVHPRLEVGPFEDGDASETRIDSLGLRARSRFHYVFDLGDEWRHEIVVEKTGKLSGLIGDPRIVARVGESPPQYEGEDEEW